MDGEAHLSEKWRTRLTDAGARRRMDYLRLRLGSRYASASLENFEIYEGAEGDRQREAVAQLRIFGDRMPSRITTGAGLILLGPPGTGKDHLLAAMLFCAVSRHRFIVDWFDGARLFQEARFACSSGEESLLIKQLCDPQILALSDPQPPSGDFTDYQASVLRNVIDRRYRDGLSTWVTSNIKDAGDAGALLTPPVVDRLKDGSLQIACSWRSYRRPAGAAAKCGGITNAR